MATRDGRPTAAAGGPDLDLMAAAARATSRSASSWRGGRRPSTLSQQQLTNDVDAIEAYNADAREVDDRVLPRPLGRDRPGAEPGRRTTGRRGGPTSRATSTNAADPQCKPTLTQFVANPSLRADPVALLLRRRDAGPDPRRPPADRVDPGRRPGPLAGHDDGPAELRAGARGPSTTSPRRRSRSRLGGESVVATGIHRFWKAGQGWVMARDLKPGDVLRTLGGTVRVGSVETEAVQPVFNLEVADGQSFFVGGLGAARPRQQPRRARAPPVRRRADASRPCASPAGRYPSRLLSSASRRR